MKRKEKRIRGFGVVGEMSGWKENENEKGSKRGRGR